jgi:hypothetical protein
MAALEEQRTRNVQKEHQMTDDQGTWKMKRKKEGG